MPQCIKIVLQIIFRCLQESLVLAHFRHDLKVTSNRRMSEDSNWRDCQRRWTVFDEPKPVPISECEFISYKKISNFGYYLRRENFSDSLSTVVSIRDWYNIHCNYGITVMGTIEVFSYCFVWLLPSYYQRALRIWHLERHKTLPAVEFTNRADNSLCWKVFVDTLHLK